MQLPYKEITDAMSKMSLDDKLPKTYKIAQEKIWDGEKVLSELIQKHGKPSLSSEKRLALINVITLILWGELAAWTVAGKLSAKIFSPGAKLAATAQTHDESRHFTVFYKYMTDVLDHNPAGSDRLPSIAAKGFENIIAANTLPKMILGMHLMVEPVALTIFKKLRTSNIDPILSELLLLIERDEARHIALGVNYLPWLLAGISTLKVMNLFAWQLKILKFEIDGLNAIREDLNFLGIDEQSVFDEAERRQILCAKEMTDNLGFDLPLAESLKIASQIYREIKKF